MRRQYAGGAKPTTLASNLGGSTADVTILGTDFSNYPDGTVGPFFIVIDRGTVSEEKILCSSRTGNTISVYSSGLTNGRGSDGTAITSHNTGASIEHIFTAVDANDANLHVNSNSGVHGISGSVVGTSDAQTLTNKTINGGSVNAATLQKSGVDVVTVSGSQTLTDKTLTAPVSTVSTNARVASYTLALEDSSKIVEVSNASATTVTIPLDSSVNFPVGSQVIVLQTGAGQVTIAGAVGVTVNGTPGLKLRTQWSIATLIKRSANTWVVAGDLVA